MEKKGELWRERGDGFEERSDGVWVRQGRERGERMGEMRWLAMGNWFIYVFFHILVCRCFAQLLPLICLWMNDAQHKFRSTPLIPDWIPGIIILIVLTIISVTTTTLLIETNKLLTPPIIITTLSVMYRFSIPSSRAHGCRRSGSLVGVVDVHRPNCVVQCHFRCSKIWCASVIIRRRRLRERPVFFLFCWKPKQWREKAPPLPRKNEMVISMTLQRKTGREKKRSATYHSTLPSAL